MGGDREAVRLVSAQLRHAFNLLPSTESKFSRGLALLGHQELLGTPRGGLVVEEALYDALKSGQVGGAALERLQRYHWPGNVRELRNVITRAVALAGPPTGGETDADFQSLPFVLRPTVAAPELVTARADRPFHEAKDELIARFEREYLTDLVQRAAGNLSQAARIAGLERKFLYKLLERAGLRAKSTLVEEEDVKP